MCPPAIIAGVSIAASIGGRIAQHNATNAAAEATQRAANEAAEVQRRALLDRQTETEQDLYAQLFHTERQVRKARSLAAVGAGEAGVAGLSAQAVLDDLKREGSEAAVANRRQLGRERRQIERELTTTEIQRRNRIAAAPRSSGLGLALGVAGTAIDWAQFEVRSRVPGDQDPDNEGED